MLLQLFPRYVSPDGHHQQDAKPAELLLIQHSCAMSPVYISDEKLN